MTAALDVTCYHHGPDKGGLLLGAMLPAAERAAADGLAAHLERHWLHGPHLRLRLRGPAAAVTAERERAALAGYAAAHPSRSPVDTAELLARSAAAGRAELVPGPYEPIHPDGTVLVTPADDGPLERLLGAAAVPHRHTLLRLGLPAVSVSARVAAAPGPGTRVDVALTAMAAHAGAYPYGLGAGYNTFLSHVEDFLFLSDVDGALRARFDRVWAGRADAVTGLVRRAAGGADPVGAAWRDWAEEGRAVCAPAFRRGELPLVPGAQYAAAARDTGDAATALRWDPSRRTDYSDYHRQLGRFDYTAGVEDAFGPYRFATNVLYQLLLLCDVTPVERYLAAYLLSRAAERITGRSWQEALTAHLAVVEGTAR